MSCCDGDYLDVPTMARSIMVIQLRSCRGFPVRVARDANFTDSIDVSAVAIMGDALYKDIRLSGKQVRKTWAGWPFRWARGGAARQARGARKRDAAKR